ncbi:MAG: GHKL domain-containing protein, partial [Bacteroidales bacterium]|nr:GHKL domain-containing protein [Bacteroidales bacterium]
ERTEQLEHSNRELRDFAQIVSHDLKAPLRAISQLSYWISQDYADNIDEDGQKKLSMLLGRVKRMDNLIDGILQYSRAGKQREKETTINLHALVEETIKLINPPDNIEIIIENQLPEYIGDPTRLGQLFQNLIDNAIKFMDKPEGLIKIGCHKDSEFWQFYVSDNGCGIEEKYFDQIFKIFQRLVSRDDQEGAGIGLSLVKRIVQIHGGDIWLKSKPGEGTSFYFTLPVREGKYGE